MKPLHLGRGSSSLTRPCSPCFRRADLTIHSRRYSARVSVSLHMLSCYHRWSSKSVPSLESTIGARRAYLACGKRVSRLDRRINLLASFQGSLAKQWFPQQQSRSTTQRQDQGLHATDSRGRDVSGRSASTQEGETGRGCFRRLEGDNDRAKGGWKNFGDKFTRAKYWNYFVQLRQDDLAKEKAAGV